MFKLDMKTGNSAFTDPYGENDRIAESQEVARILREVAYQIENGIRTKGSCMDYNGNKVGEFELS